MLCLQKEFHTVNKIGKWALPKFNMIHKARSRVSGVSELLYLISPFLLTTNGLCVRT